MRRGATLIPALLALAVASGCFKKPVLVSNVPDSAFREQDGEVGPGPTVKVIPLRRPGAEQPQGAPAVAPSRAADQPPAPVPPLPSVALPFGSGNAEWSAYLSRVERYLAAPSAGDLGYLFRLRASLDAERWMAYSRKARALSPEVEDRLNETMVRIDDRIANSRTRARPGDSLNLAMGGPPLTGPFVWPLERLQITSPYGYRRDPFLGRMRFHDGIDLSAPPGSVVHSAADGEVIHAGPRGLFGLTVVVDHRDGHRSLYAHLETLLVGRGSLVRRGDPIGQVGSTGRATGPHLHFSVYYRGRAVDPTEILPGLW